MSVFDQNSTKIGVLLLFACLVQCQGLEKSFERVVFPAEWTIEEDVCQTPTNDKGSCVVIESCKPIMDIINKLAKPLGPKVRNLLRSYQCGFEGNKPKVCCPPGPISFPGTTTLTLTDEAPDVGKHRNIQLLPKQCGPIDTGNRIINGNKTGLLEFPWMALLSYKTRNGPDFKCGGTIINKNYILTAAHCIKDTPFSLIGIRIGEHDIKTVKDCEVDDENEEYCTPPVIDLGIEEVIPHPDYNRATHANDIGLLRVRTISFDQDHIKPVCLPVESARTYNFTNRFVVVTGWGITETGKSSSELLKVSIKTVPDLECRKTYDSVVKITNKQLCAGGANRTDSCGGDSGGPLHVIARLHDDSRMVQQGIVSFGPRDCGRDGLPGVYTKVAFYMDWILNTIKP